VANSTSTDENSDQRIERCQRYLTEQINKTGEESETTAIARRDLAAALEQAGRLEEAVSVRMRLLESLEGELGTEHLIVAQQELHVADDLRRLGRLKQARQYAEHALVVFRKSDGSQKTWLLATEKCLTFIDEATHSPAPTPQVRSVIKLNPRSSTSTSSGVVSTRITKEWKG
jgi:tetratricopeptide (TPR) repeat protein